MATKDELQKQLSTIRAGLLDFTAVGEEAYFKKTGQTKLTAKELPRYTDVYNKAFEEVKNVKFNVAADVQTLNTTDKALYISDPAIEAERAAKKKIESVESFNKRVTAQQANIKSFLASETEAAKTAVLNKYLTTILNPKPTWYETNPFEWDTVDINTREGWNRWQNTPDNMRYADRKSDYYSGRSTNMYSYRVKLTPAQAAQKRKITEAIERVRFLSSPTLQKTYAKSYAKELEDLIAKMK